MQLSATRNSNRYLLLTGLLIGLAVPASANVGTLLMWAGMGHLFVGNIFVGIIEALFLARICKVRYALFVPFAIGANYLSMAIGFALFLLGGPVSTINNAILDHTPLYRLPLLVGTMTAITFCLSVLIEWPSYYAAFRLNRKRDLAEDNTVDEQKYRPPYVFRMVILAHVVSYLLLATYYLVASGTGFIRNAKVVHGLGLVKNPKTSVYFIANGSNYHIRLDGSAPVKVSEKQVNEIIEKYLTQYPHEDNYFGRLIRQGPGGPAFDLRGRPNAGWSGSSDFWGTSGLTLTNEHTGERFDLGLEIPFVRWQSQHATILPGDQVIYQFGPQIVIFDINSRRMSFIARGSRPIVVIE